MEFSKDEKGWVAEWIDRQFDSNRLFPCECSRPAKDDPCVCASHIRAYKTWSNTPRKRRHIRDWIEEWLNAEEVALLKAELAKLRARVSKKSGKKSGT